MSVSLKKVGPRGRVGLVLASVLLAWLVCAAVAFELNGWPGVLAASAAALVFAVCGALAQAVGDWLRTQDKALAAMGVGMALRTVAPLGLGLFWQMTNSVLARAGAMYYLLTYYLVTLAVETILTVGQSRPVETNSSPR